MTEKASKLQSLIDAFDTHFRRNKKRPSPAKVQFWLNLQVGSWQRSEVRQAVKRINAHMAVRWNNEEI